MTLNDQLSAPATKDEALQDLAFLKSLDSDSRPFASSTGVVYAASGVIFGTQCALTLGDMAMGGVLSPLGSLVLGFLPTVIFIAVLVASPFIDGRRPKPKGPVQRAIAAAFAGTGLANLVLIAVFAFEAFRREDFTIWLFYAVTVCALQGAVWYGAAILRRRWWMGAVSAGWLITALVCGLTISNLPAFLLSLTIGLYAFMAVPGFILMRLGKQA